MNINIQVIDNSEHRPGIGGADWFFDDNGDLQIRISKMSDWRLESVLALHEMHEAIVCKHQGVTVKQVDEFDIEYEKTHMEDHGLEAGDDNDAPYREAHCGATASERILALQLGIKWHEYDLELGALPSVPLKG